MPTTATPASVNCQSALDYGRRSWRLAPIYPLKDGRCTCRLGGRCSEAGVHLIPNNGTLAATADLRQLGRWWRDTPDADIALATGTEYGVWALLARGEAGREALQELESQNTRLPRTPRIRAGGDLIYLFRWPPGWESASLDQLQGRSLDSIGEGGWVRLPIGDESCTWEPGPNSVGLATVPAWLLEMVDRQAAEASEEPAAEEETGETPDEPVVDDKSAQEQLPSDDQRLPAEHGYAEEIGANDPADVAAEAEEGTEAGSDEAETEAAPRPANRPKHRAPADAAGCSVRFMAPKDLRLHPEYRRVPPMRPAEYAGFLDDVKERGVLVALELQPRTNVVLDGRCRLQAANDAGLEQVPVIDARLDGSHPVLYMLRQASKRRQLTDDQRAVLAEEEREWLAQQGRGRQKEAGKAQGHRGQEGGRGRKKPPGAAAAPGGFDRAKKATVQAARAHNVSERKVRQAQAVKQANPDLAEKVKAGEVRLSQAMRQVNGGRPPKAPSKRKRVVVPKGRSLTITKPLRNAPALAQQFADFAPLSFVRAYHAALGAILIGNPARRKGGQQQRAAAG